jgi:hypothetical protein
MNKKLIAGLAIVALAIAAAVYQKPELAVQSAQAATPNVSVGAPTPFVIPIQISGSYTTTTTVGSFNMPMPCSMIGVGATARQAASAANNIDVKLGGTTILSAPIALNTGTYSEGTIATATITDEGAITVILGVSAGVVADTTVLMTCARR